WDFARRFMPQLTAWAAYLAEKGMDPENQLSTDDFAGHLAHNTNLSIKAIEALGAFVEIARGVGDEPLAKHYEEIVRPMPAKWSRWPSTAITTGLPSISRTPGARNTTWCGTGCSTFICSHPKLRRPNGASTPATCSPTACLWTIARPSPNW